MREYRFMDLLRLLYENLGANHPRLSLIIVIIVAGALGGFVWDQIGRSYRRQIASTEQAAQLPAQSTFTVSIMATFRSDVREVGSGFWIGYLAGEDYVVSPANVALSLRITNTQPHPAMIGGMGVEVKRSDGNWAKLMRLSTLGRDIYRVPRNDLSDATLLKLDLLDELLFNRSIQPYDPVTGFLLFRYPETPEGVTFLNQFRTTITDVNGVESTLELESPQVVEPADTFQATMIKLIEKRDLSQARVD